jgi:molybdopterin-guanine dinucleotide biosynthesis protein A
MGCDKALLKLAGRPLIAHALAILAEAALPVTIAGADPSSRPFLSAYAPVIEDPAPGLGPLAGICSALASTSACYAVFLPVDLPLLPPSLISCLLNRARITGHAVTVPTVNGFTQTFPAILDRSALSALQIKLYTRHGGCYAAFLAAAHSLGQPIATVAVEFLAQSDHVTHADGVPTALWFLNVNFPQDLERAGALMARGIA